ncbi:MAG: hypothetical protein A2087_11270 [Spirochaetes bacterium GWD1_61_31]|nr:MAG: hypothetical protein A2Y37_01270 [Spirochaetes bacterium GWB1_60_80]OHD33549.1 MAG: hypothetical protein A2004_06570 [Spirochaetes bacterium GWC1_61_12]OHD35697.1 MAG: hypothetical protein A2087_11270 [Spirochaetes bacterium GWD1_61_31]OHD41834.1 MAG: hypothetical protein A2Y35_04365 [Spirochaetes bacterium GWE1_60_18]OHD57814.1 MAG: hypothetical protein A2Y32_14060 [Spirochaetes bacterium GWF1_60_12]HAP42587.1 hypothetical protein [Spirochaetaceae bacterium]
MTVVALFEAKNRLTDLVRQTEHGPPIEITRHGQPVAMLMGIEQYRQVEARTRGFASALELFRADCAASLQAQDATDPFADLRDQTSGREPRL